MAKKDYHKGKKIQVYIPEELYQVLKAHCDSTGETLTAITIESLTHFANTCIRNDVKDACRCKGIFKHMDNSI